METVRFEPLCGKISVALSPRHRFSADSVLLSRFAAPRKDDAAAELCCGCGATTLLWFSEEEVPPRSAVGVDIDAGAVELFSRSIAKNSLSGRVGALCADLRRPVPDLQPGSFDLVVCNPPYFPRGSPGGPRESLRQEMLLTIEELCAAAAHLLKFGGRLCVCYRPARLCDLLEAMRQSRIEPKRLGFVSHRPGDPPWLALVEGRLGGGRQLDVLPAAALENPDGSPSDFYKTTYRMR